MKQIKITKKCEYTPPGSERRVELRAGQVIQVTEKQAEEMVSGSVAEAIKETVKKPVKTKPLAIKKDKEVKNG